MKPKTNNVEAIIAGNHNETLVRDNTQTRGLKVKTQVKAGKVGEISFNHNETLIHDGVSPKSASE